ncbi:hypothetical protein like AT5G47690 [Hibiscus trionum]|uniref:Uncharacterized protein n=1 Tax=Hibiscus trionum TaxID=183268 RepID=A0A9W7LT54_HIBTR|nr:hypothetical protein like AT5G47690 [Hibiscus trionum]
MFECLLSDPSRPEAPRIISALRDLLLDYDENVRKQVVDVICDVACHSLVSVHVGTIKLVAERLRDKSLLVKKYTMERLADIFRVYCAGCSDGSIDHNEFDWIPGKIFRCFYDKDFSSDMIESVLCGSLFPTEFSIKDKVKCWIRVFSRFDKIEVKALERMLEQKQRLQQEMQKYLSLRQRHQDSEAPEIPKKVLFSFQIMPRSFSDPAKAEESFQTLDRLKDANIWKILLNPLDPNTSFHQASSGSNIIEATSVTNISHYSLLRPLIWPCGYLLYGHQEIFKRLVDLIGITSVMEVLIRLIGADEHMYSNYKESMQWIEDTYVLVMIADKFSSSDSAGVHANAAETLCAITRFSPPGLAAKITSPNFTGRLFRHSLEDSRPKSVLVNSLSCAYLC